MTDWLKLQAEISALQAQVKRLAKELETERGALQTERAKRETDAILRAQTYRFRVTRRDEDERILEAIFEPVAPSIVTAMNAPH